MLVMTATLLTYAWRQAPLLRMHSKFRPILYRQQHLTQHLSWWRFEGGVGVVGEGV